MTDNARKTGPAVEAHFQFLMWLVPAVRAPGHCDHLFRLIATGRSD